MNDILAQALRIVPLEERHAAAFEEMIVELEAAGEPFERYRERLGADWDGVAEYIAFWRRLWLAPWPERGLVRSEFYVLVRGERILGEVALRLALNADLEHEGGNVGYRVRPSERGHGYATRMLRFALARLGELGFTRALLTVRTTNAASLRVVAKCAGEPIDEVVLPSGEVNRRFWLPATAPSES